MAASQDYIATTVMGLIALKKCNMRPSRCRLIAMMPIGGGLSIIRGGLNVIMDISSQDSTVVTAMNCTASSRLNVANRKDNLATYIQEQEMLAQMPTGGVPSIIRVGRNALQAKHWRVFIAMIVTVLIALKRLDAVLMNECWAASEARNCWMACNHGSCACIVTTWLTLNRGPFVTLYVHRNHGNCASLGIISRGD